MATVQVKIIGIFPPKNILVKKGADILDALEDALKGPVADLLEHEMEKRVKGWTDAPRFESKFYALLTRIGLIVMPAGRGKKKWIWATAGTRDHLIVPRRAKLLTIKEGYDPRTKPGNIYGGPGSYSGDYHLAGAVRHPGVKPREFERHIVQENTKKIFDILQQAANKAAKP